ncbi:hypothetical protein P691DRAFT_766950 [Macrolepiota fuliginosa MF-IS2]|uniref:ABC transporter domain-containing protein n=1 Tax=Macrolepiota fuliginosa MF-IS2 TaxID=1400762 RepID=A0A9P6BUZ3_9AGAR|nr:hypothetical protein P691DRAFT_766950 [Macrolepiota fuliginosa MF-IS2]
MSNIYGLVDALKRKHYSGVVDEHKVKKAKEEKAAGNEPAKGPLNRDPDMLGDGDTTEIDAKGVSLSVGQKARVAFARTVYMRARYALLDDPLSAADGHTFRFL